METLISATRIPAEFMGVDDSLGTIEKGKFADLVLLDANPVEDIINTTKINTVIKDGQVYDKKAIQNLYDWVEKADSE